MNEISLDHVQARQYMVTFFEDQILGLKECHLKDGSIRHKLIVKLPIALGYYKIAEFWPKARLGEGQSLPSGGVNFLATYGVYEDPDSGETREGQPKYIGWEDPATGKQTLLSGEVYRFGE